MLAYMTVSFTCPSAYIVYSIAGNDSNLIKRILDPSYLRNSIINTFTNIEGMVQDYAIWASIWVGESGGAFQGGGRQVSDRFVNSFWYYWLPH
jgi:heparanase 1